MAIRQITPFLHVQHLSTALHRLCDIMGFTVLHREPGYAYVEWEGCGVRVLEDPEYRPPVDDNHAITVYADVADADRLFEQLAVRLREVSDTEIVPPADKPWGQREFLLRLPDGNWIAFGHALPGRQP